MQHVKLVICKGETVCLLYNLEKSGVCSIVISSLDCLEFARVGISVSSSNIGVIVFDPLEIHRQHLQKPLIHIMVTLTCQQVLQDNAINIFIKMFI